MLKLILYAFLIWFLYNLIFKFIVPVYRTSSQLKKKFREMNEQMNQQHAQQQRAEEVKSSQTKTPNTSGMPKSGDYIDFEEVK